MKKVILLLMACMPLLVYSQIDGFKFLKTIPWESSENSFLEFYKGDVVSRKHYFNEIDNTQTDWEVKNIYFGEFPFTATLYVDSITKKLIVVSLSLSNEITKSVSFEAVSRIMDEILTSNYGSPDARSNEESRKSRNWYLDNMNLDIRHFNYAGFQLYNLEAKGISNEPDFRGSRWGDSKSSVMEKENRPDESNLPQLYLFSDNINGLSCKVAFIFVEDKLAMAKYLFDATHTNKNDYITDYNSIVKLLSEKYGEPRWNSHRWKNDLYKDDIQQYGFAVSLGHLDYSAGWFKEKTDIDVYLHGENYEISFFIQYVSKKYEQLKTQKDINSSLDKL